MTCPNSTTPIQCAFLDTAGMASTQSCDKCPKNAHIENYIKIHNTYPLEQLLNMLPKTLVKGKRSFFRSEDVFDIDITKDGLNNWVISYIHDMGLRTLFTVTCPKIHLCAAKMATILIENKYMPDVIENYVLLLDIDEKIERGV
jgi:hypothetical protein